MADLRTEADRWPRFVPAALDAGFAAGHAVPMRAAGMVLGALGIFGTRPRSLSDADRLVGQTLAHIASVARPLDRRWCSNCAVRSPAASHVEQAKGFLRRKPRRLGRSGLPAAARLCAGPRRPPDRRGMPVRDRSAIAPGVAGSTFRIRFGANTLRILPDTSPSYRLLDHPLRQEFQLRVLGLAQSRELINSLFRAAARSGTQNADRLIDHRPVHQCLL